MYTCPNCDDVEMVHPHPSVRVCPSCGYSESN